MTYVSLRGDPVVEDGAIDRSSAPSLTSWGRYTVEKDELYLWTGMVHGIPYEQLTKAIEVRKLVAAFGVQLEKTAIDFNVQGVIVLPFGPGASEAMVTFVLGCDTFYLNNLLINPIPDATKVQYALEENFQPYFPGGRVLNGIWQQYADGADNDILIDTWRAKSSVWRKSLKGGLTDAWTMGLGCFQAKTADGLYGRQGSENLVQMPPIKKGLHPPPGLLPGLEDAQDLLLWGVLAAVLGYAAYEGTRKRA